MDPNVDTTDSNSMLQPHVECKKNNKRDVPTSGCVCSQKCFMKFVKSNAMTLFTFAGVLLGVLLGIMLQELNANISVIEIIEIPGDLFMRALFLLIAPLVVTSIVSGIVESKPALLKEIGIFLPVYCLSTTFLAAITGVGLHYMTSSITLSALNSTETTQLTSNMQDTILDIIRNVVPVNFVRMFFQVSKTEYLDSSPGGINGTVAVEKKIVFLDSTNMCGLIFFSVFFGIVVLKAGGKGEPVKALVLSTNHVIMEMLRVIMLTCPLAIVFLIGGSMGRAQENMGMFKGIIGVTIVFLLGSFFHCLVTLNAFYYIFVRKNPFVFAYAMKQAFITAWATMSSAATLPTTIRCMEENNKMDKSLTRVMLPIAATINMDGACMMVVIAVLYLAEATHVPVTFGTIIIIVIMSSVGSIGCAAVPGTLLIMLIMACTAANISTEFVPMFLALEFIVDRFRTGCNIYGDCVGVAIVSSLRERKHKKLQPPNYEMKHQP